MKIKIENVGPIKEFEFDLDKKFNLIVGGNNIGKSYAITIVYLIVKAITDSPPYFPYFMISRNKKVDDLFDGIIKNLNYKDEIHISKEVLTEIYGPVIKSAILDSLQESLLGTFDSIESLQNKFTEDKFKITVITNGYDLEIGLDNKDLTISSFTTRFDLILRGTKKGARPKFDGSKMVISYPVGKKDNHILNKEFIFISGYTWLLGEVKKNIRNVYYLPASRSGLYQALSAFGQIISELSKKRSFLKQKVELPGISEPLSDYFLKLSEIKVSKKSYENKKLNEIAKKIEKDILHGEVDFDVNTKRLLYSPEGIDLKLDLSSTSSMVSELSPIVSYLRYVLTQAEKRDVEFYGEQYTDAVPLMFIEEPEAHLHPEIQIKMMEIFAELVSSGVNLAITSHSNYIFNKASNLLIEGKLSPEEIGACVFRMGKEGSCGCLLGVDSLGIDDENFVDASAALYEEKINLLEDK